MNALRGAVEIEINGIKRYAKFGTYQTGLFCEDHNMELQQFQDLFSKENIKAGKVSLLQWVSFYYTAFKAGAIAAKQPQDFDAYDVSCWFDEDPSLMDKLSKATEGANGPNEGNRQQRRAAAKVNP